MVRPIAFAVPILTLAMSSSALAQPSMVAPLPQPASPDYEPEVVVTSYQNQILLASGIGFAALLGGAAAEGADGRDTDTSENLFALGLATTFLAPPIIHFAHGEGGRGVGSFLLRSGAAIAGGLIAMEIDNCDPDVDGWFCDLEAFGPGALVGVGVASLIDAFAMSEQRTYRARPSEQRVLAPVVRASGSGGQVGLAGTF